MRKSERHRALPAAALLSVLILGTPAGAQAPAAKAGKAAASAPGASAAPAAASSSAPAGSGALAAPNVQDLVRQFGEAAKAGDWPRAYELMREAFAVQKTFDVLGNLGAAELQLGKYPAAAEHLSWSLHDFPAVGKPEAKKVTEELLAKAMANVGALRLKINPPHARIRVDERVYGPADYRDLVFVEPGNVAISAGDASGYVPLQKNVHAEKGKTIDVELTLSQEGAPAASGSASAAPTGGPSSTGPNKVILGTGIGLAVAGIGVGIGLLVASSSKANDARTLQQQLVSTGGRKVCAPPTPAADCKRLDEMAKASDVLGNVGVPLLMAGAATGAATLIYGLVTRSKAARSPVKVGLVVAPQAAVLSVNGSF